MALLLGVFMLSYSWSPATATSSSSSSSFFSSSSSSTQQTTPAFRQHQQQPLKKTLASFKSSSSSSGKKVYRYNVCNGLSNQLLYHAASIARALEEDMDGVEIPNHFIVNGVQTTSENVIPNPSNSVPFGMVFDEEHFLQQLKDMGVKNPTLVTFDFGQPQLPCPGIGSLNQVQDPEHIRRIVQAFRPSPHFLGPIVDTITTAFEEKGIDNGICLHHRDGQDWHDHCARWGSIPDGIYRGNCLGESPFLESLEVRGMTANRWVYYCGDHEVPQDLLRRKRGGNPSSSSSSSSSSALSVGSANGAHAAAAAAAAAAAGGDDGGVISSNDILSKEQLEQVHAMKPMQPLRDVWALIDFYACGQLEHFIGNSVSTFSAIQIALRQGGDHTYWMNSQSIPLASFWRVYQIPLVYTYTELSMKSGKDLFKASIASVRRHMPNNKIHVLYNGNSDRAFRSWLENEMNVLIHDHYPTWRGQIEEMRKHGNPATSHLFQHAGNYLGTWQRIDIPLVVDSEYCLLLDSDTIITRPFTLADFGLDLTRGLAMSSEMNRGDGRPSNAGVTLMNIPFLRRTYDDFLEFILDHVETGHFNHSSPSDQGAYLDFYRDHIRFLSEDFNFKPYWPQSKNKQRRAVIKPEDPFIVHFHGPKPHDYMKAIMGKECDAAFQFLCRKAGGFAFLCPSLKEFAIANKAVERSTYCEVSFPVEAEAVYCNNILDALAAGDGDACPRFASILGHALQIIPYPLRLSLDRDAIEKKIRTFQTRKLKYVELMLLGWFVLFVLLFTWRKRLFVIALLTMLWAMVTIFAFYLHLLQAY